MKKLTELCSFDVERGGGLDFVFEQPECLDFKVMLISFSINGDWSFRLNYHLLVFDYCLAAFKCLEAGFRCDTHLMSR